MSDLKVGTLVLVGILAAGANACSNPARDREARTEAPGAAVAGGSARAQRAWDMVADARSRIESLTVEDVVRERAAGAIIVDLRETEERLVHGAIPGAVHAPRGMLEFWADPSSPVHRPEFDPAKRIVLHCAVGGRSALATAMLADMGYVKVAHLEGGFTAWRNAGKPVEKVEAPSGTMVKFTGVAPK